MTFTADCITTNDKRMDLEAAPPKTDRVASLTQEEESGEKWRRMEVGQQHPDSNNNGNCLERARCWCCSKSKSHTLRCHHLPILLVSFLIFAILAGVGITLNELFSKKQEDATRNEAMELAVETGRWFSNELDLAILPLFSMAQFATELEIFADLPDKIGQAEQPGSLPFLLNDDGSPSPKRNVTGVCDQPELVSRFTSIASAIKKNAKMEKVLVNIQLAPHGVICLLHPMNNTEDFSNGTFLDSSGAWGLDLFNYNSNQYIARKSIAQDEISIAGPLSLFQCPTCGLFFIARLPIQYNKHQIVIDGEAFDRWGFATALINWNVLVGRSHVRESFEEKGFEFQLTRTDWNFNKDTQSYDEEVVVLAESENFGTKAKDVSTALQTTNNEWVITVQYDETSSWVDAVIAVVCIVVAFCVSFLVYTVLIQKQSHTAQEAQMDLERKITAYFAHELRNPMFAVDCALKSMPDNLPVEAKELVSSMSLCSSYMASIMNNILDVRQLEEGKMILHTDPLSLQALVVGVHDMALPSVKPGVDLLAVADKADRDWVFGDKHRLQQILINIVSNAIKYTVNGSITIKAGWEGELVRFECEDTGPGIPREEQMHLFERFTTRGGAPGSGLGLAIAKQMVDLMGGSIRFESDPTIKPGTNCIVLLPLKQCEEPNEQDSVPEHASVIVEALSFFVVDDIKMNREMLKRRIQKSIAPNSTVREAATGEGALKICERENFDVIIMDQYMEGAGGVMLGTDAIIALRRLKVESVIVGCSGNDLHEKFFAAGSDFVWKKPMPANAEIIRQLRGALGAKEKIQ